MTKTAQPFDQNPHLFLPPGWNDGWLKAKTNALAGQNLRVLLYGDSITMGTNASDLTKTSWASLLKKGLASQLGLPLVGDYWHQQIGASGVTNHPWGAPLNGTSYSTYYGFGWNYVSMTASVAANAYQTYTTPDPCTAFDVFINDWAAGTWQFVVDSGAGSAGYSWALSGNGSGSANQNSNVTITNLGVGTAAGAVIRRLSITGLPLATHTFTYGWQNAANTAAAFGAAHYPNPGSIAGLYFANIAAGGAVLYSQETNANKPANCLRLLAGYTPQQDGVTTLGFGWPLLADLAIIMIGVNDCNQGGNSATDIQEYGAGLQRVVAAFKRGNTSCSVVLVVSCLPNPDSSDCNPSGYSNQQWWSQYIDQLYTVAQLQRCAVLNIHSRWGETPAAQGFLPAGNIHPTDAGYADIYAAVKDLL